VPNDLSRLSAGRTKAHTQRHGVKSTLKALEQQFTGNTFTSRSLFIGFSKLSFQFTIDTPYFLFLPELSTKIGEPATFLTMLTGSIRTSLDCTLIGVTLLAFQEQLFAFSSTLSALRISISSHLKLLKFFDVSGDDIHCVERE
jgi:hypothetical protein